MIDHRLFNKIESSHNNLVKQIKIFQTVGVKSSKLRSESGLALIEGVHLIQAWLSSESETKSNLETVIFSEQSINNPEITEIVTHICSINAVSGSRKINLVQVVDSLVNHLTQLGDSPFILGIIKIPTVKALNHCIENTVVLDGIQDSGNVGTILRTAAAAGYKNVISLKGSAQTWSPKVLRSAMGAHTALSIWDGIEFDDLLKDVNLPLISARLSDASNLYDVPDLLKKSHAWVFGNEGAGVSQAIQDNSTGIFIPQSHAVESLNVAAAAAICLFESRRVALFNRA